MIYLLLLGQHFLLFFLWPSSLLPVFFFFGSFLARKPLIFADLGPVHLLPTVNLRLMGSQKKSKAYSHSRAQLSALGINKFFFFKFLSVAPPDDLCSPHGAHFFLTQPSFSKTGTDLDYRGMGSNSNEHSVCPWSLPTFQDPGRRI